MVALHTSSHSPPPPPHRGRRVDACLHQKPSDRDMKGLLSELDTSLIEFRRHKDWCLNPTWRNVLVKVCGTAAYLVPRGGGAVREANGTSLNCRARIPEACSRAIKGINDMQFIFKENSPKRAAQMGKGIPTELDGAGGALKMRQQTSER